MGLSITKMFKSYFEQQETKIIMVGLDAAGKTSILYKMRLGEVIPSIPTIGFLFETVLYKNLKFIVWDIGGADKLRLQWKNYYLNTKGLIFVVDSSDEERIDIARKELIKILDQEELKDTALLVLANKQDLRVMSITQITEKLQLDKLDGRNWHIQGTCVHTGDGLYEGFDWLSKAISISKNN